MMIVMMIMMIIIIMILQDRAAPAQESPSQGGQGRAGRGQGEEGGTRERGQAEMRRRSHQVVVNIIVKMYLYCLQRVTVITKWGVTSDVCPVSQDQDGSTRTRVGGGGAQQRQCGESSAAVLPGTGQYSALITIIRIYLLPLQTSATSQETIQETHKWLTLAQLSPQAWNFCWDLIHQDKKHEVQFFGASCLAVKVTSDDDDDVDDNADDDLDAGVAVLGGAAPGPVRWSPPEAG